MTDFLDSIGVDTTFPDRGQPLPKTVEMVKYAGFRWVRGGIEGLTESGPTTLQTYLDLHRQTGVRFSWGLVSGGTDLKKLIETARPLAEADALLAFEGNNEPNNWGVTYQGEKGGGRAPSWMAVAKLQRDLYKAVKSDSAAQEVSGLVDQRERRRSRQRRIAVLDHPQGRRHLDARRDPSTPTTPTSITTSIIPARLAWRQQDVERRRSDVGVQGRWPVRQLWRHLGEAFPRLFGSRVADACRA